MSESDLKKRTKAFALRILKLVDALPKTTSARALATQLVRSGTSVAANYRAARRAKSTAHFLSKLGDVEEEAMKRCSGSNCLKNPGSSRRNDFRRSRKNPMNWLQSSSRPSIPRRSVALTSRAFFPGVGANSSEIPLPTSDFE